MNLRRPRPLVSNLHHPFSVKSQWRNAGHRHVRSALNIRPSPQNFEGPFRAINGSGLFREPRTPMASMLAEERKDSLIVSVRVFGRHGV